MNSFGPVNCTATRRNEVERSLQHVSTFMYRECWGVQVPLTQGGRDCDGAGPRLHLRTLNLYWLHILLFFEMWTVSKELEKS